jgi:protein ImuA
MTSKAQIISRLQQEILVLEGFKHGRDSIVDPGLGIINHAFPNKSFPKAAVHEFILSGLETAAASSGFVMGLLSPLMNNGGVAMWISAGRQIFPPALKFFGVQPDQFVFIDLKKEAQVMWAMEEALKCPALTAVVGQIADVSFTASRRLQLAVEQSQVTGFILRNNPRHLTTTACVSRWKITPLPSYSEDGLPGVGFPEWRVELLRIRNGRPGVWTARWSGDRFSVQSAQKDNAGSEISSGDGSTGDIRHAV